MDPEETGAKESERPSGKDSVRLALIDAATRLIARRGVYGVTTRAIAQEARVNQGLITRYFGSKKVLVQQVARSISERLFEEAVGSARPLDDLLYREEPGHKEALRALMHIILVSGGGSVGDSHFSSRFFQWLRDEGSLDTEAGGSAEAWLFLISSLVLGSELVAPGLQSDLQLTGERFKALRKEAFQLFQNGFRRGHGA